MKTEDETPCTEAVHEGEASEAAERRLNDGGATGGGADLGFPVRQEEVRSALVFGRPRAVDHELDLNLHLLGVVFTLDALQGERKKKTSK